MKLSEIKIDKCLLEKYIKINSHITIEQVRRVIELNRSLISKRLLGKLGVDKDGYLRKNFYTYMVAKEMGIEDLNDRHGEE